MSPVRTYKELRKAAKVNNESAKKVKIAVLGDCATQHFSQALKGMGTLSGYQYEIYDADYNQIVSQIIDAGSELYEFDPKYAVLVMCIQRLYEDFCNTPLDRRMQFADNKANEICRLWNSIHEKSEMSIFQLLFLEENDNIFGSFGLGLENSFVYQVKKLNYLLMEAGLKDRKVYLIDVNDIAQRIGIHQFIDEKMMYLTKMYISLDGLPYVVKKISDLISAIDGKVKKCVILDLDNTLWGGVIGDDGMEGIQIGDLGMGHAYSDFQAWLKELKNRGIILGICSKNNEDTAKEPFISHPDMVLRLEDFSIFVANWNDKATNLRYIQKTLNIGMDSIVFIDDNPFERNLVSSSIEDITVPDLPEDPSEYKSYLEELNLFETASYSEEDVNRTKQYQAEVNRQELENEFASFDDYLKGLDMVAEVAPFDAFHFPRIAQLTQRSNQFNLRTVRYTEDEIAALAASRDHFTLYFTLKDRFGDYGLISVVILDKKGNKELFISEWLMSCRVLKRGMEEFILNTIISLAKENGYQQVVGEYIPTKKNSMVKDIYPEHGFKEIAENRYVADVDTYKEGVTFIEEVGK